MTWAFPILPASHELLSGYLSRVAFAHGSAPHAFYRLHLNDGWFWTRDIDRGAAQRHHRALSHKAGLGLSDIQEMTLRPWIEALTPPHYSKRVVPAIVPWVNVAGIRQENRERHALQYCPDCLAVDGIVDRRWRLSFYTRCSLHHRLLLDHCLGCEAPFVPHRSLGSALRCFSCQRDLQAKVNPKSSTPEDARAIFLQEAMVAALLAPQQHSSFTSADLMAFRSLASVLLTHPRAPKATRALLGRTPQNVRGWRRLEFARIGQRADVMSFLCALLDQWPETIRALATKLRLTQLAFKFHETAPSWLHDEVMRLPIGEKKSRRKPRRTLEEQVTELEKTKPRNWRASRAALLIRVAQRP